MRRYRTGLAYYSLLFLATVFLLSCFKNLTHSNIIYINNFEDSNISHLYVSGFNNGIFGPVSDTRISNFNGTRVLGKLNSSLVSLYQGKLPSHEVLRVEFDLYLHDKWKNDLWKLVIDGSDQLLTGFSNDSTVQQAYPNWLGNGSPMGPAGRDAANINLPGACSLSGSSRGTSLYRIIRTIPHSGEVVRITCSDAGNFFNDTCQRSWSIDNLKVSVFKN